MSEPIRRAFPSGAQDQFNLRLPDGMRDRIREAADRNGRSMNSEIVAVLEAAFPPPVLDIRAVESVLHYIASAPTKGEAMERLGEVNARFHSIGSPLRAEFDDKGQVSITTDIEP